MCYRCRLCDDVVPHNTPMKKLILYKEGGKAIKAELGVCTECDPNKPGVIAVKPILRPSPNGKGAKGKNDKLKRYAEQYGAPKGYAAEYLITKEKQEQPPPEPLCDVCSQPIGENGQQTAESTLCEKHLPKRPKGKSKR